MLAADAGASDAEIATSVGVGGSTVYRTKRRLVAGNLEEALSEEPRAGGSRKLSGKEEALLVATACSSPPSDVHFPEAEHIRVVLDNLSTHSPGALYQAFPPCDARRLLRRLEFHYVPKHASWLNMVEIEIGVLRGQCLDRRIATPEQLVSEIAAWERQRNATGAKVKWMFTTEKARAKMGRAYPTSPDYS